jgi:quercetin dioxygenase-like cupin family protein
MLLAAALAAFAVTADGQAPPSGPAIKRAILQRFDLAPDKEVVMALAEVPPGLAAGRHTHPGPETSYVIEGSASLEVEGEVPRIVKAGDSFAIPAGKIHDAKVVGDKPVKVLATYIIEKGKPLATPAN